MVPLPNIMRKRCQVKKPRLCPICHRSSIINLSQHLNGVHRIGGQERKQLIQREMVGSEVNITDPQLNHSKSHIEKHISFFDMLQRGERLRTEPMKKATQRELKAILELCLNMNEGNLSLPKRKSHRSVVSTLANRDIPLLNKKKWMLKYNKILYIIHPALEEWKGKFRRV